MSNAEHTEPNQSAKIGELEEQVRQLKKDLSLSREKYNALFHHLNDEVHLWEVIRNSEGEIITWKLADASEKALTAWGMNKDEVIGKKADEIFGDGTTKRFLPTIRNIFKTGEPESWDEYFEPTGQHLKMTSISVQDFFFSTGKDITPEFESHTALEKSEEKYRNLAENLPGIVLQYQLFPDGSDALLYVSSGIKQLYEITQHEALTHNEKLWERVHPEDLEPMLASVQESARSLSLWDFEHRILLPDGRIKWVSMRGTPKKQPDGSVIWNSFGIDITRQKEAEIKLDILNKNLEQRVAHRTEEILKVSKELELYWLAAEQAKSGVWHLDIVKNELKWDSIMYDLYGVDKKDFPAVYEAWETSLHPEDKERTVIELNEAIEGKKPFDTIFRIIQPKTQKTLYIRGLGKVLRDENGKALSIFGTNWDVTREMNLSVEREQALQKLKKAQSQLVLSEKMASLGVLTAGVAHEINNPLNYILGGYHAIQQYRKESNKPASPEIDEYLDWIKTGAERAASIVKSLNTLSRNTEVKNENLDIQTILEDCILVLHHKHKDRVRIRKQFDADTRIHGNIGKLHQVFLNLISNAIDAIDGEGTIEISTKSTKDNLIVAITDNGRGIEPENLEKIMDPFFTTKAPGQGTGLGLSISKTIIDEHGGKIEVQSEVQKGTTFTVQLPKTHSHGQ